MTNVLYLLNIACSAGQNTLGKYCSAQGGQANVFNFNKAIAGVLAFGIAALIGGFSWHLPTVLCGTGYGISLCLSTHMGFKAFAYGPMSLTSVIASFSLLIPLFFGICCWKESLTAFGIVGILMLLCSILLIRGKSDGTISFRWLLYATATLLANGICSIIQKYHQLQFPSQYGTEFMLFAWLCVALMLLLAPIAARSDSLPFQPNPAGLAAGALNGAANYIVLRLAATENASVLFPIVSATNILASWLIGIVLFKEKLTVLQTIGLLLGIASIVLLKL